jgi:hypothetical protein
VKSTCLKRRKTNIRNEGTTIKALPGGRYWKQGVTRKRDGGRIVSEACLR